VFGVILLCLGISFAVTQYYQDHPSQPPAQEPQSTTLESDKAVAILNTIAVKGRAAKTGYERSQFGDGWSDAGGCDTRNIILWRDLTNATRADGCKIGSGTLNDPYTGKIIQFVRGSSTSSLVQIDHVVALSNAWQTGAQTLDKSMRVTLANDPLELLAVDGAANQQKGDGDAATWLPSNKPFRCQYAARQIAVKAKYNLWVTSAEKAALLRVLGTCPNQSIPSGP
jgi:hypothetical protein